MKNLFTKTDSRLRRNDCRHLHNATRRLTLMLMALAIMMLAPSTMRAETEVYNFNSAAGAAYEHAANPNLDYYANFITSGDYNAISGAKIISSIKWKTWSGSGETILNNRLAFKISDAASNTSSNTDGLYLRAEKNGNNYMQRGLFCGKWNQELAILGLNPGDKVTFYFAQPWQPNGDANPGIKYIQSVHCSQDNSGDIYENNSKWFTNSTASDEHPILISSKGDLRVSLNYETYINSIKIEPAQVATYQITESADKKTSTFEFTGDGVLEDNDFAILNLSASFGSTNDYLVVSGRESHMIKSNGTETLETDPQTGFQPSAGSFYTFKPTASGTITVWGTLDGNAMHLFVYNPQKAGNIPYNGWDETVEGNFFRETFSSSDIPYSFSVDKDKIYYICIDNNNESEHGYAFHLSKFMFVTDYSVENLGIIVNNVDAFNADDADGYPIALTRVSTGGGSKPVTVKRCSATFEPSSLKAIIDSYGWLRMSKPTFKNGADHGGTVIWNLDAEGGSDAIVVTFPYSASFDNVSDDKKDPNRTYGHTWNFIDPRNSDSNIGNCQEYNNYGGWNTFTTTGILSIGQDKDVNSQFHTEVVNREWVLAKRQEGSAGGGHDPMYKNTFDMEGDNADMIWETEGLWFDTGSTLSCIYNENDAVDQSLTNPLDFKSQGNTDPDRYVGLMPVSDGKKSSFTIPGLRQGDRVLIFMSSGEGSGDNGIFLNITGALDALGNSIDPADLYKAGGTNWKNHKRYEGCYHFIKDNQVDEDGYGSITFDLQAGSMCKLLYIRIYTGQRINTNSILSNHYNEDNLIDDSGRLLFISDKGDQKGQSSTMSLRFSGKGQMQHNQVLTCSGNLNYQLETGKNQDNNQMSSHFSLTGKYNHVNFMSQVGEIGVFRLRMKDMEYNEKYVGDFSDRNFTVGYRDKVDSYPYTWDFTDIQGFSSDKMEAEASDYPIAGAASDEYGDQWDISLFDSDGKMKLNTGFDPISNNEIFAPHKIKNGNQLWAGGGVIPEAKGLWFYSEDDVVYKEDGTTEPNNPDYASSLYNDCLEITSDGIHFCNAPYTDDITGKSRVAWWNYKMVVPDVPMDGAVYLRMKRDNVVPNDAMTWSDIDNAYVPFVATRFKFASQSSKTNLFTDSPVKNGSDYSFYPVPNSDNEWILAVKNTTGNVEHLTFTLNGWIVKKVAVSTDFKKVNKFGWATESRARVIDPSLTSEMTGYNFKHYIVTGASHADLKVELTEIGNGVYMPEASENGKQAYIIRNMDKQDKMLDSNNQEVDNPEPGLVKILKQDGKFGFHLFVPDMNDYLESRPSDDERTNQKTPQSVKDNLLLARLDGNLSAKDGDDENIYHYVMTTSTTSSSTGKGKEYDDIVFARVPAAGMTGGKNVGYLPVDCSDGNNGNAKMNIVFAPWVEPEPITDAIEVPFNEVIGDSSSNAVYYNLNGQKIDGKPTEGGIYIMNGKKVVVK